MNQESGLRPFRFAVQSFHAETGKVWQNRARQVESLGYDALYLADHFLGPGPALEATHHPHQSMSAVPAIAAAATATSTLRVGCRVFCNDYRHPVLLAKEVATLDLLSEGRIDFGIGAGWLRGEYEAAGLAFDPAGERIERLAESIDLLKKVFSGEPLNHHGKFYSAKGFRGSPRPVQKPAPPLMIGGGGPKILSLAAREADIVSFNFDNRSGQIGPAGVQSSTSSATAKKVEWVRNAAGERFHELELEIGAYFTFVTENPDPMIQGMAHAMDLTEDEIREHPHGLFGGVEEIIESLLERRERFGISRITIGDEAFEAFAPIVQRLSGQ
ncbi:MAG: TIGR03621 family F420-dependent LLM class oxidoreductase [Myxococcota bacterium]|nr:TIGR03621 family F420-dependent LLM class oxidoreductase [Myxococcota bacterium]